MPSITTYASIWAAFILMGVFIYPETYTDSLDALMLVAEDPVYGTAKVFADAFSSGLTTSVLAIIGIGTLAGIVSSYAITGGFNILFIIPMLIFFAVLNIFLLPTATILDAQLPYFVKITYIVFLSLLTIMTGITFTAGRP